VPEGTWIEILRDLAALHDHVDPPPGFRYEPAAAYRTVDGRELTMHLYAPVDPEPLRAGVLFVHGGGWMGGCPTWHLRQCCALAERGNVAATMSYRLAPADRWPAQLEDVLAGVAWLREQAPGLGLDRDRLVIAGGSAGGHLALHAALAPETRLAGTILWYPAWDLRAFEHAESLTALLGDAPTDDGREAATPRVHAGCPPVLTLAGELDTLTPPETARALHRRLDELGVENRLVVYPGRDHQFDLYPGGWEDSFAETVAWVERVAGPLGVPPRS